MRFTPAEGLPKFREAVGDWMRTRRQIDCTPAAVFATDSAAAAIAVVARASLKDGDEVLIPDPVDFLFQHTIERAGGIPVRVGVKPATTAEEFIAALEARLTPRTRMLWLCNPHNPLGAVYSRAWLQPVAEWAIRHGLRILSDEIWSDIVYPPHQFASLAALSPEIPRSTVTVYAFSNTFALHAFPVRSYCCPDPYR